MSLNFHLLEPQSGREVKCDNSSPNIYKLSYPCSSQSTCTPYVAVFPPGLFLFEVWGSQGGTYGSGIGGLGGYSQGIIDLKSKTKVFLTIGGRSSPRTLSGHSNSDESYNGGGRSGYNSDGHSGSPGGGSTDIRLEIYDFWHRIIVGGGGGGGGQWSSSNIMNGGYGGGISGGNGVKLHSIYGGSSGGNDQSGGSGNSDQAAGSFGIGSSSASQASGGGGGWFGGSGGYHAGSGGGGGSGYINTEGSTKVTKYAFNQSNFLRSASMSNGVNSGIGRITITVLSLKDVQLSCSSHKYITLFIVLKALLISDS